jgi:hypothetical protein
MPAPRSGFLVQLKRGGYMLASTLAEARDIPGAKRITECQAIRGDTAVAGQWYVVDGNIGPIVVDQAQIDAIRTRRAEARAVLTAEQAAACGLDVQAEP